jgi:hypothetical protein
MKIYAMMALAAALPLSDCQKKTAPPTAGEACEMVKRVFYPQCSFRITKQTQALLEQTLDGQLLLKKSDAVKLFFRGCPQHAACVSQQAPK